MIVHLDWNRLGDIRKMATNSSATNKEPLYKRSPWLPRGQVRRLMFLVLMILAVYGSTRHWTFIALLVILIVTLSPKILLTTAYYYGRSALFLGQWFSK